jgi:hypothetical protein
MRARERGRVCAQQRHCGACGGLPTKTQNENPLRSQAQGDSRVARRCEQLGRRGLQTRVCKHSLSVQALLEFLLLRKSKQLVPATRM